jgi:hypothetical protein
MNANLRELLLLVGSGAVVGAVAGLAIRKFRPEWRMSYSKIVNHPKSWWALLVGFLFFGFIAYGLFSEGNVPWATFFAVVSLAELACLFWVRLSAAPSDNSR